MPGRSSPERGKKIRSKSGGTSNFLLIHLTNDPCWRYTVNEGLGEYVRRYLDEGRKALGLTISLKLLLEPALVYCARYTGDQILELTEGAFDVDQYKEGSLNVPKAVWQDRIAPLGRHFAGTSAVPSKRRWLKRQVLLSCLFIYANHLVQNTVLDDHFVA